MAIPVYVGSGANTSGGNPTPGLPAGRAVGDVLYLFCVTNHYAATGPAGWTAISGFPVLGPPNGGGEPWFDPGGDHAVRVYGWWKRVVGGETNPTVLTSNGHGVVCAVRGQATAGIPVESVTYNAGAWNATSTPAGTTASPDCLVLTLTCDSATGRNTTSYTNADLSSLTEQFDPNNGGAGNPHYATGGKAAQGAFGATAIAISGGADGEWIGVSLVLSSTQTSGDASISPAEGVSSLTFQPSMNGAPRSLYLYVNHGINTVVPAVGLSARDLFLYANRGYYPNVLPQGMTRALYLYANRGFYPDVLTAGETRDLYLYVTRKDGEVEPYLNHINPTEQYVLGQVDLYGDGFGQHLEAAAGAAITVDSVNGVYAAGNAVDRSTGSWVSNSNRSNAWIRFTFGGTKRIAGIALEGAGSGWGVPRFLFSSGAEVNGVLAVPDGVNVDLQFPTGVTRRMYWLATPRDTTFVEIRGTGTETFVGLYEVWIYEEAVPPQAAETSRAVLNLGLPEEQTMGIVAWQNRSPNWYPANSGVPPLPAATVTVPSGAVSGLVRVEETT